MEADMVTANKGKRTNSLAFARTDCHTCASSGEQCDRRRPQCSMCLGRGRRCGGFAMPLSWDSRRMWTETPSAAHDTSDNACARNNVTTALEKSSDTTASIVSPAQPRRFRFVRAGSKLRKRRKTRNDGDNPSQDQPAVQPGEALAVADAEIIPREAGEDPNLGSGAQTAGEPENPDTLGSSFFEDLNLFDSFAPNIFETTPFINIGDLSLPELLTTGSPGVLSLPQTPPFTATEGPNASMPGADSQHEALAQTLGPMSLETTQSNITGHRLDLNDPDICVPATFSRLHTESSVLELASNDHAWLLEMYDSEFCVLPLTSDISVNPFRCHIRTSQGSRLLFHSILALCCQHLKRLTGSWSAEADEHRRKAVKLLDCALQSNQAQNQFHLLEPILILFTLDCTLSASGTWTTHLNRAHSMLQACGGPSALTTPRVRSQVGMLLWWDATLALISRQGPIMKQAYMEFLVRWERQDEWSFFDLTGCPRDLFVHLFHLAELARQSEIALSMEWLSFNIAPVMDIEQGLIQWKNEHDSPLGDNEQDDLDEDTEKQYHEQQDRYHCAEAWRCALLLYLERVFKSDRQKRQPPIHRLARRVLDHIRCCRRTSQTQKQLLLPIFLAGSETSDEEMRGFVKEYCSYWGEKSRYSMFNSVPVLLDEVWTTQRWWGAVIDSKTKAPSPSSGQVPQQLLFG